MKDASCGLGDYVHMSTYKDTPIFYIENRSVFFINSIHVVGELEFKTCARLKLGLVYCFKIGIGLYHLLFIILQHLKCAHLYQVGLLSRDPG